MWMNALNRRNEQNIILWRKFLLDMLKNLKNAEICIQLFPKYNVNMQFHTKYPTKLKTVQICTYMPNKNLSIFFRMFGIEFKSVWKPKKYCSKKYMS